MSGCVMAPISPPTCPPPPFPLGSPRVLSNRKWKSLLTERVTELHSKQPQGPGGRRGGVGGGLLESREPQEAEAPSPGSAKRTAKSGTAEGIRSPAQRKTVC